MYAFYTPEQIEEIKAKILEQKEDIGTQYGIAVDCETFGKKSDCVVFNLAAHVFTFDPRLMETIPVDGLPLFKNYRFGINEQVERKRKIEDETWEWWCSEDRREAWNEISKLERSPFIEGMEDFYKWLTALKKKLKCRVYYRGQDFDYPIITSLLNSAGIPQKFIRGDAPRDTRTYIDSKIDGRTGYIPGNNPITEIHTALGDVINDIRQMQLAWCISNNVDLTDWLAK